MSPDPEHLTLLGRHIRRLRRERDLSQEAVAAAASIHRNHISAIERGTKVAGILTLIQIAGALSVPPAKLLEPFE